MMNDENVNPKAFETGLATEMITAITTKAIKKYKISAEKAAGIIRETIEKDPKFFQFLNRGLPLKEILKTRVFHEIAKKAQCKIYYQLRQYQKSTGPQGALMALSAELAAAPTSDYHDIIARLAQSHVSTQERLGSLDIFYREIFKSIASAISIIDIGCGLHPLLFPFSGPGNNISYYAALDKDKTNIAALEVFSKTLANPILYPRQWHIKEGWHNIQQMAGIARFDVAFLMKIVPVVSRIQRGLLPVLLKTPADTWIITGSRASMTKYVDIEKRERKIIKQFIGDSGKHIEREFLTPDEFCLVIK